MHPERMLIPKTLTEVVARLRHPTEGCAWDLKQTHETLSKNLREESAEVLDAIAELDRTNPRTFDALKEELGDLWLQVVFHAFLAKEQGYFSLEDVEATIVAKLIRRHPHVFGNEKADTSEEALSLWQEAKKKERKNLGLRNDRLLDHISQALSVMDQAVEIGKRCASVGFEWPTAEAIMDKVKEELHELEQETTLSRQSEELGDLLFSLIQWARKRGIDPELALRQQMLRFKHRFSYVEDEAGKDGGFGQHTLEIMERNWQISKDRPS